MKATYLVKLLTGVLAGGMMAAPAGAQSAQSTAQAKKPSPASAPVRYVPNQFPLQARMYYQGVWGVDSFRVKWAESGELIRVSWRVVDTDKAAPLNDKKVEPSLNDPQAGVSLVVPEVPNVGKMRQTSTPKEGMTYWMAFSNVGRRVKRGDRVDLVIGKFHADGLLVE